MCNNHVCSKFDFDDGCLVSANSGRWCSVYSSGEEENHQMFIRKLVLFQLSLQYMSINIGLLKI